MSGSTRAPQGISYLKAPSRDQVSDNGQVETLVAEIQKNVREHGDRAVRDYSLKFDKADVQVVEVTAEEREAALAELDPQTRADTEFAIANVRRFAEAQLATILPLEIETLPGVHLGHRVIPLDRAGCHLSGADRIFRIGGAQAIAAMAYGTESVPAVNKIAGPSEIFVVADHTGDAKMIATYLLAQAERDVRTRVGLITTDGALAEATLKEVERQLHSLSTASVAGIAWKDYGEIVVYSDKCVGINHTLPTSGAGRYTGGLWVGAYVKIATHQ